MPKAAYAALTITVGAALFAGNAFGNDKQVKAPVVVSTTCAACHGVAGISASPTFPNLAAQGAPYLIKQINDFRNHLRADAMAKAIMWPVAKTIPVDQIPEIAAYYASQPGSVGASESAALVAAGRKLYEGGEATDQLPACAACHGSTGLGLPPLYPRLAGQHMAYVTAQLNAFKTGHRTNDPQAMMQTIASKLSEEQMKAVAAYLRTL